MNPHCTGNKLSCYAFDHLCRRALSSITELPILFQFTVECVVCWATNRLIFCSVDSVTNQAMFIQNPNRCSPCLNAEKSPIKIHSYTNNIRTAPPKLYSLLPRTLKLFVAIYAKTIMSCRRKLIWQNFEVHFSISFEGYKLLNIYMFDVQFG